MCIRDRRIAEQVVGAFFDDPTHEAFANKPAVGPEYDGGVGIMLTEEVDDFLIDFLEHGTSILTASIQPLKSSKAPTNYFTPNILRKSWSRLVVSVVHLDALAFPVAAT